jgi:hypothetical protein
MFISLLYMFRATMCPSSGENTVPMHTSHPYRVTNTRCRIGTVFSPDDGHSCPKHVQKSNKHIKKKLCTKLVLFTRLYKDTRSTKHKKVAHLILSITVGASLATAMIELNRLTLVVLHSVFKFGFFVSLIFSLLLGWLRNLNTFF